MSIFWIWLIVAVVLFAIAMYKLGAADLTSYQRDDMFWTIIGVCTLWPIVLVFTAITFPFIVIYKLGARKRKKNEEHA